MVQAAEELSPIDEQDLPPAQPSGAPLTRAQEDQRITDYATSRLQLTSADVESQRQSLEANRLQEQQAREKAAEALKPKIQEVQNAIPGLEQAAQTIAQQQTPTLPQPPKLANFLNKDTANMMMAIASVVAGLNSNGRVRGIRANRALAAGINGYVSGNLEVAKLGLEDWKNQMETQLKENEMMRQHNLDVLTASKMTLEAKQLNFELEAKKWGLEIDKYGAGKDYIKTALDLDKELAGINASIIKAVKSADPALQKLSAEQYKILMMQRAQGLQTGDPMVDKLTPENAKIGAGLNPKPTQAQTKAADQLIGTSHVLDQIQSLIPEMDKAGFLAKSESWGAKEAARIRRLAHPGDPALAAWRALQGSIVGYDRIIFNDIGARVRSAYDGSLALFDEPYTKEGLTKAIGTYKDILLNSPEAKRVLAQDPGALAPMTPSGQGGQSMGGGQPQVMRSKDVDGRPIWKMPTEQKWHYE